VNFQPWKLIFTDGGAEVRSNVRGIGKILPGKLYLIDLGIVTRHVAVALEHEGKTIETIAVEGRGKDSAVRVQYGS
jgi:hypothetical protein